MKNPKIHKMILFSGMLIDTDILADALVKRYGEKSSINQELFKNSCKVSYLQDPDKMEKLINILSDLGIVYSDVWHQHAGLYLGVCFAYVENKTNDELIQFIKSNSL